MTSPRQSRSTLRRVERAAMQWYNEMRKLTGEVPGDVPRMVRNLDDAAFSVMRACAAHAAAKAKKKGKPC